MFRNWYARSFTYLSPDSTAGGGGAPGSGGGTGSPSGGGAPAGGGGTPPGSGSPSAGSPSPMSGAPGAQPQGGTPGAGGSPADHGPVDYNRFNEVNTKYNSLRWAEGMDPQTASEALKLWDWFDSDPDGAYEYMTGIMRRTGRLPGGQGHQGGQGSPQNPFIEAQTGRPLPDVRLENGQTFYSGPQLERLMAWRGAQQDQRLQRLEGQHTAQQARAEARTQLQNAEQTWPQFKENIEAIFDTLQRDRRLNLEGAYNRVVVQGGKLEAFYRTKMGEELRTNGQAGQGNQNPQGGAPTHNVELSKLPMKELFRREMRRRGLGN